jgi:hypothetical protein
LHVRPHVFAREADWPADTPLPRIILSGRLLGPGRKLRLFAVACCRRIAHLMGPERAGLLIKRANRSDSLGTGEKLAPDYLLRVVDEAERAAEGLIDLEALKQASGKAYVLHLERNDFYATRDADELIDMRLAVACVAAEAVGQASDPSLNALLVAMRASEAVWLSRQDEDHEGPPLDPDETAAQCLLARDIFGLPLHLTAADPNWLTASVRGLAEATYEGHDFALLPVLADALEDAGCAEAAILSHLRSPGPHTRGCWALDLILAKQ